MCRTYNACLVKETTLSQSDSALSTEKETQETVKSIDRNAYCPMPTNLDNLKI